MYGQMMAFSDGRADHLRLYQCFFNINNACPSKTLPGRCRQLRHRGWHGGRHRNDGKQPYTFKCTEYVGVRRSPAKSSNTTSSSIASKPQSVVTMPMQSGCGQERSRPILEAMEPSLRKKLALVSQKSRLAEAIRYMLARWAGLGHVAIVGFAIVSMVEKWVIRWDSGSSV
jgi:hypothetical protein